MKINVVYNSQISGYEEILETLEKCLISRKAEFQSFKTYDMNNFGDFTFVIGGDGTILNTAKFYSKFNVPVLGINIGRLGFLSQISKNDIDKAVENVLNGNYTVEERLMLETDRHRALNDFVIKGCNSSRTSKFYLELNGKPVCDYIADGLIISTPTGSTAYGLSAGGPVLHPNLDALVVVPICPHTLNARPIVIPAGEIITVKTDEKLSLIVDGCTAKAYFSKVNINLAPEKARLAFLNNNCFYSVLRQKLQWGISPKRETIE